MPRAVRTTSTDYSSPYRPPVVRMANALGAGLECLGLRAELSVPSLLEAARRRTGLEDFGDHAFEEPLGILLDAIEGEARLNSVGRLITRERLIGVLANRLRAERCFREHPEIEARPLAPPLVITGLQRTGTTFLHRLLAADPEHRALLSWEAINPAPLLRRDRGCRPASGDPAARAHVEDARIKRARTAERALAFLAPDFFAIHPVEAESPEEDVLLLDYAFLSTVPEATLRVPTYSRWLERQDQRPAYRYMYRLLQLLQWQRPAERWVLKSPHHLEYLDALLEVFRGVKILHTHRDPYTTVASFCSMIAHGRGVFSDRVDPLEVGRDWLRKTALMIDRAMAVRRRRPETEAVFLDIRYQELVRRPIEVIEGIYAFLGRRLTAPLRRSIERAREENVQHRYGNHRYRLEDFGLSRGEVSRRFSDYRRIFDLQAEDEAEE